MSGPDRPRGARLQEAPLGKGHPVAGAVPDDQVVVDADPEEPGPLGELAGERMQPAFSFHDQENEHSCFSDNTLADLKGNATSIQNVLLGKYGELSGIGIDQLIEAKDPKLAQELRDQIQDAIDSIDAIPAPFDQSILVTDESEDGPKQGLAAIDALQAFSDTLGEAAKLLDVKLELE